MNNSGVSVFFPCINEEGNIENIVGRAEEVLRKLRVKYEIIIIDDGSSDQTGQIADKLSRENSNIRVIHHSQNLGYGEALKSGFYNARYNIIVYTDGDGQFDFSEVTKFLEKIKDHDIVIGYRIKRQDPFIRKLFGKGWRLTLLTFFGLTLKDVDCGFKMVRKEVLEKIPRLESQRGAMINAELAIKAKKYGFREAQVGVRHSPRLSGKPTGANLKVIIKSYIDLIRLWWKLKDQKMLFFSLIFILFIASFLRFYRLPEYMTFLGDEGRDAIVVKNILIDRNLPLIGPPTSVGNMYLGPLYYYMMTIPMSIFWLNPAAAAGMNAFIGVLTVAFIYYLGKVWFNRGAGLIAAYLYAISPVTITYSRSSWNPNPAPFFALLAVFGLFKAKNSGNYKWLILSGIGAAAAIQMHYLALILLPFLALGWVRELLGKIYKNKGEFFWTGTLLGISAFLLLVSPLVIFDFRHNFLNYRAINELFFYSNGTVDVNFFSALSHAFPIYNHDLVARYITAEHLILTPLVSFLILISVICTGYLICKKRLNNSGFWILNSWLLIGILGLALYKQDIYDHYLGFMNPVPFLLLGAVLMYLFNIFSKAKWLVSAGMIVMLVVLTAVNLQRNPLINSPNNQLKRTQAIARFVIEKSQGKDFNFALLAQRNYDSAYQFYLDLYGYKPKQVPFYKTEQLFFVF